MKLLATLLASLLLLASCATSSPQSGGEYGREKVQLCIQNRNGSPVRLYDRMEERYIGRTARASGGCIEIPPYIVERGSAQLCVSTTAMNWCEPLPYETYGTSPVWTLDLGFRHESWRIDVWSLRPGPATD